MAAPADSGPSGAADPAARAGINIRASQPADIAQITEIYAHAVRFGTASFEVDPPDADEMARRRQILLEGGYPYLTAERDGAVLGYAYAGPYRARKAYRFTVEDSVYVAAPAHRQGLGRALLTQLIAEAERGGFRQMIAVIGDSAQTASIALHYAAGFELAGTLRAVGFKHGHWLDTVLMQRRLAPGGTAPAPDAT